MAFMKAKKSFKNLAGQSLIYYLLDSNKKFVLLLHLVAISKANSYSLIYFL